LQEIYGAFPGAFKALHNDMTNATSFPYLAGLGVQLFNPTHQIPFDQTRRLVGESVCLMGGVSPLETLCQGGPADVRAAAEACHAAHPNRRGLILSVGGGTSPGTPAENVDALIEAARLWD
jgi:uroporphyrinogen decarboxylase